MYYRNIGNTNITVSTLGLGTVKFGRNQHVKYPYHFQIPSNKEILYLLDKAKEWGINLLDTAPAYGDSEKKIGEIIASQRHQWVISTKAGEVFDGSSSFNFQKKFLIKSVEQSLTHLKTDYIDIVFIHSNGKDQQIIEEYSALETLKELKKSGKIRAIGMSTKTLEGGILALNDSDVVMVTKDEKDVIQYAHKKKKSVFIKKILNSGNSLLEKTFSPVDTFFNVLQQTVVSSIIVGTIQEKHLQKNIQYIQQAHHKIEKFYTRKGQ